MVKTIRRKRSAKHTDKEEEEEQMNISEHAESESICRQNKFGSPIRIYVPMEESESKNY